ncbi:MAG TPA: hypothetical protein VF846_19260, partial [Thermoanaerobaculia bacterium]
MRSPLAAELLHHRASAVVQHRRRFHIAYVTEDRLFVPRCREAGDQCDRDEEHRPCARARQLAR